MLTPVLVGRIAPRADHSGFNEVLRIRKANLDPNRPGTAETFATDTENANGIVIDRNGNLFVSGPVPGNIHLVRPIGGRAEVAFHRDGFRSPSHQRGEIREVSSNGSSGPLEAPTAIVFVGGKAYTLTTTTQQSSGMVTARRPKQASALRSP